jgi:hypothetical protein
MPFPEFPFGIRYVEIVAVVFLAERLISTANETILSHIDTTKTLEYIYDHV